MRQKPNHFLMTPRVLSYLAGLLLVSFVVTPLWGSTSTSTVQAPLITASPSPSPAPTPIPYDVAPSSGIQGKEFDVVVTSNACLQNVAQKPIKGFQLYAPNG